MPMSAGFAARAGLLLPREKKPLDSFCRNVDCRLCRSGSTSLVARCHSADACCLTPAASTWSSVRSGLTPTASPQARTHLAIGSKPGSPIARVVSLAVSC